MSDKPVNVPDYARMYKELDARNPGWRGSIEAKTGNRPGIAETPKSPKETITDQATGSVKHSEPTIGQPNKSKRPASKVGSPTPSETKVKPIPSTQIKPSDVKQVNPKPQSDDVRARAKILPQDQAKDKAVRDMKQKGDMARKETTIQSGKPLPPAPKPQHVGQTTFAEKVRASPPQKPVATTSYAEKVRSQPAQVVKPQSSSVAPQQTSWAQKVATKPQQAPIQNGPKPLAQKPPAPKPPTIRRGR